MAALFRRDRRHPAVAFAQDHGPTLLIGIGTGAALALFLDRGLSVRRRRLVERATAVSRSTTERANRKARDLRNRTRGALVATRNRLVSDSPDDEQLEARVRSQLGHHARQASRIETDTEDGVVTLRGEVLSAELGDVISGVRSVRGVREVRNELSVFEDEAEFSH